MFLAVKSMPTVFYKIIGKDYVISFVDNALGEHFNYGALTHRHLSQEYNLVLDITKVGRLLAVVHEVQSENLVF